MNKWKVTTIGNCSTVLGDGLHGTPKYTSNGEYAFINGNNLREGKIIIKPDTKLVDEGEYRKYKKDLNERTVLVSINGTLGNVATYNGERVILGKSACYFNVVESCDVAFMKYVVSSPQFQQYLQSIATGTTIKNVSLKQMREYEFLIPDLETQKKIASVLKSLDDKIALNNKTNDNLEQQARLALNHWIEKHSEEYKMLPLSDVATVNDDTYSPKEQWPFVKYLDTSSITDGAITEIQYIVPSVDKLPSRARRKIITNDIVFSTVRPNQHHFGIIKLPVPNMLASTGFAVIRSKVKEICNELIYLRLTENSFIEAMQQLAEQSTSTFPSIKPSDLYQCKIPYPVDSKLMKILESVFSMVAANQKENEALSQLRDILLPKLMTGEIL